MTINKLKNIKLATKRKGNITFIVKALIINLCDKNRVLFKLFFYLIKISILLELSL